MLRSLHIENIAVVERADVEFGPGLNVLTGETGAGKSILIDALYAVLGGRTSRDLVRTGAEKCLASAVFDADGTDAWCAENGVEAEDGELLIQRTVTADGHGSCRVGGAPVTAGQLRELGALLADIHGQNDGRLLLDESRHLGYLDSYAGLSEKLDAYGAIYGHYLENEKQIAALSMDDAARRRLAETLSFRADELEKAELKAGEETELEAESELLRNSEKLREATDGAFAALYGNDASAVGLTGEARGNLSRAKGWSAELAEADKSLEGALALLEDAAERVRDFRDGLDFSPEEFDRVEERLSLLHRLEKKYGVSDEERLLAACEDARKRLDELEFSEDTLEKLRGERKRLAGECAAAASTLTQARKAAGRDLAMRVERELKDLSMPSVRFVTEVTPLAGEPPFGPKGADEIRFLMSANAGEAPGRISKIASGGELSRIMLALKNVFGALDPVPTAVFDEIDTGVSGVAASRVAEKLGRIGREKQVLCVTHLPQIAAMADEQYVIRKTERGGRTYTTVDRLTREGRRQEIARLIGGDAVTGITLASAEELLKNAETWKEGNR